MSPIKVIFLDIDGVLNTDRTTRTTRNGWTFIVPRYIKNLKHIIDTTGAKVVLSSDWRYNRNDPALNQDFLELKHELFRYGIRLYDFTPELSNAHRGAEIQMWLDTHPETINFVILDDRTDIGPNESHWVQTVMSRGLGLTETERAISILLSE